MSDNKFVQLLYVFHSKGYIELAVVGIGTCLYNLFHKIKKKRYTRIKCPNCKKYISLKDGKPYTSKSK